MRLPDEDISSRLARPSGEWRSEEGLKDAAVLAILVEREGVDCVPFTLRRADLKAHAGQVSFPGGTREGKEDAVACAIRESCEELGLSGRDLTLLGRLPDRVSIAGFRVAAFVARLSPGARFEPLESEVAEVFEVPFRAFLEGERWYSRPTRHPLARFRDVPYFDYEGRTVWGLTGIILRDLLRETQDFDPPVPSRG